MSDAALTNYLTTHGRRAVSAPLVTVFPAIVDTVLDRAAPGTAGEFEERGSLIAPIFDSVGTGTSLGS